MPRARVNGKARAWAPRCEDATKLKYRRDLVVAGCRDCGICGEKPAPQRVELAFKEAR